MPTALIIGSGPAAAGAALALSQRPDLEITVLDLGLELEGDRQQTIGELSSREPAEWDAERLERISLQPVNSTERGLPEKRSYGSDFAFRNIGQLDNVFAADGVNRSLASAAYGGFSNVWGAQLMPYTAATFKAWPIAAAVMEGHYRAILSQIPFAGEEDDLARMFPLFESPAPLPEGSARTTRVLQAYGHHRKELNRIGVTVGKARLALKSGDCVRCGLCMTGCPLSLIYSASHTFDELRRSKRVSYHGGLLALEVAEDERRAIVWTKELATGRPQRFEADRVYLACGAVGTTRLVLQSLRLFDQELTLKESAQFTLPMVSHVAVPDPRSEPQFALNQFNMVVALDDVGIDVSQLHFYTFNPAFVGALPRPLRSPIAQPLTLQLLRRLGVAIGYLPSWASPPLRLTGQPVGNNLALPRLLLTRDDPKWHRNAMLRQVLGRVLRSARRLDLYPVLPKLMLAAGGKSYHWGGTFPHQIADRDNAGLFSDRMGRVGPWTRIHLVDASVFPNVPATTFTLTIMANSHRIATETLELLP